MHRNYLKAAALHGSCIRPLKTVGKLAKLVRSVNAFQRELTRPDHDPLPASAMEPKEELKIGLALGGGFARGMAHIGVLKAFEEAGIPIHFIAGTSVGAVIGAAYCSGVSAKELEEIASLIRFKDFARYTLSRFGLCSNDRMTGLLQRILKVRTFEELRIPLAVTATDFLTGEALILREGPLIDPVRASCAYPGVFLPVNVRGRLMVDGLLAHSVPATPLKRMGANRVVSVYFSAHWVRSGGPRHVLDVIGQCFSIAQANMSCLWQADSDLNIEPDVAEFAYDAFERSPEMIRAGEAAARSAIPVLKSWLAQSQHEVAGGDKTRLSAEALSADLQSISAVIS